MAFPSNELESRLAALRGGTGSPDALLQALTDGELWVPLPGGTPESGAVQLPIMPLDDGPYVAVYSSAEQFARGAGQVAHMVLRGSQLAELMDDSLGLALNAGAEAGLPIRPDGVRVLRGGKQTLPAGQEVRLGLPAEEPSALLDALAGEFARVPAVSEARRALAQIGDRAPGLFIGVRSGGSREAALAAARQAIAATSPSTSVDVVFLDDQNDPISAWMMANTPPFYRRG